MENDWLITEMDDNQEIYCRGKMSKCPSSLKWQDQYGYIHETWFAYISDTMSNSGIKEDRVMKLDNERRNIIFQNNDHTISFDKEKRFIFDRRTWKITDIDRLDPHLITAVLEVTPTDSVKDNTSLRVADYVNPNYEITVDKISVLLKPSESYQLHTEVKNNGITLINPILSFSSSDQSICTVDNDGLISSVSEGSVVITVNYKESYKRITVVVNSKDSHKLTVDIFDNSTTNKFIITKSKSKEFTCVFKGNGQSIVSEAWFSLTDVNGNPTNLATITSQSNNSCIVRGDNIGYVLMNVASADKTIINSKQIQVKSAI
ncbi:Ig-like domain-containing protein [Paenibacillus pini]|uniref:Ig domain protein n=1 Tax=Paenibacillus pini JCM 16418 TaxID=1236976 RepID=W7YYU5_9BACL|nr:Ig-like domain-containing protein [Paenibacillus pini]GAF07569.1 Ig domain protein [Paenibacillus pini JCM 16418]